MDNKEKNVEKKLDINANPQKKRIYKKWWFWIIVVLVFFLFVGLGNEDESDSISNANPNSSKKIEKTSKASSSTKEVFKWKCTGDITTEGKEETKVLEVGKDIEAGEYIIKYEYKDYTSSLGQQTTNKYNRYYFVYVSNTKVSDVNGENVNKLGDDVISMYNFYPQESVEKEQDLSLKDGNFLYIHHTSNKEAGDGTLTITKK